MGITRSPICSAAATIAFGIRWDNQAEGPAQPYNNGPQHQVTLRFTVPTEVNQVGLYAKVTGSIASGNWAAVDNFRLRRVN